MTIIANLHRKNPKIQPILKVRLLQIFFIINKSGKTLIFSAITTKRFSWYRDSNPRLAFLYNILMNLSFSFDPHLFILQSEKSRSNLTPRFYLFVWKLFLINYLFSFFLSSSREPKNLMKQS